MVNDPLAIWWKWPIAVKRKLGDGANGPVFDGPITHFGKITQKRKMIRNVAGTEVVSEARVSLAALTPLIQVGSLVIFPASFGGREAEVLAEQLHHSGMDETPNFYSIDLT
ncbi:hypothetical protein CH267_02125 [Rhodococcus sp. 06-621-2]|nr:hypothetical protein [Rhodococcus sp. 06-621-2]OZC62356.1 hypothetical protein CH267_02125 [Rhodococcus sp. 06-621-2]